MIKVFRKIRQRLLTENKFSKYILYAFGEIVLVVIGILIALQINNWNEQRKDNLIEKELLKGLVIDFTETKSRLKETINLQNTAFSYGKRLLLLYETNRLLEKKDSIAGFVGYGALSWWRAEPVTGTYDAMVSTGNIGLIRNKELRRYLAEFDAELKSGFEDHEYSMDLLYELTAEQSEYTFSFLYDPTRSDLELPVINDSVEKERKINYSINALKNNKRFFGLLSSRLMMEKNRLERQEKMLVFVNKILNVVESELKP
ncbi:DUF6090 family protein [Eudoraea adriatica]|uniref:DUF6090 family protein n=1 Tax=Eudoraea adriatica TaxID=446681 RepID=UPI0003601CE0|nr:DUF6090 family protein [Eudoraea adriatica]